MYYNHMSTKNMQSKKAFDFNADEVFYFTAHRSLDLITSLKNRYNDFPADTIKNIFQDTLGLKVSTIKSNSNLGAGHVIYFVKTNEKTFVFRANYGIEVPEHYMALEKKFIELYDKVQIPVGKLLHSDCSRSMYNFDYQILEVLPGKDLETEWTGTENDYEKLCIEIGRIVAKQYKCPVNGFGRFINSNELQGSSKTAYKYLISYLDFDLSTIVEGGVINQELSEKIQNYFKENKKIFDNDKQGYLIHHDLADHNLRYEKNKVLAVFDWENAVAFDPICELGSAHTWPSHYPFKREKMIEGFIAELGYQPENLQKKIAIYFLRTMLWKVSLALGRGSYSIRHKKLLDQALIENGLQ